VEVRFEDGTYREGDFWLIPARTAMGYDTGHVEWPVEGGNPAVQLPAGIAHHFARLALLRSNGTSFTAVANGDCRTLFPPLTGITAADVAFDDSACQLSADTVQEALEVLCQRNSSLCTLLVGPGEDLAAALQRLGPNPPAGPLDALICVRAGTYQLTAPLRIENRGHIQFMGIGPGTRIVAQTSESALTFAGCTSVKVSNVAVESGVVGRGAQSTTDLQGSLTFINCPSVVVESAAVRCAGGPLGAGTCITVRNDPPAPPPATAAHSQALIRNCTLEVGHLQAGLLLVNVDRSHVIDNVVLAGLRPPDDTLLQDVDYRATLRDYLISGVIPGGPNVPVPPNTNATVTFNGQTVHFRSDPGLIRSNRNDTEWLQVINTLRPTGITSPALLERFLVTFAGDMLRTRGTGAGGTTAFRTVIAALLSQDTPSVGQGIVVGGQVASDLLITGNTVRSAIQGIHIGLSSGTDGLLAGVTVIKDNTLQVALPTSATRDRYGVFTGSANSLVVESNFISLLRSQRNAALRVEAMRLFGTMGRRVIVRHNHMGPQFTVGITFAPLNAPVPAQPLWIITENVMESATTKVDVPGRTPGQPGAPDPATVRQRIRGLNDNFA
jgi:hypothetical protein